MSGREVDVHVGGGTDIQICIEQTRKVSFFLVKTSSFDHANRALEWMIQCVVFVVGPLLPTSTSCTLDIIYVLNETRPSPFFTMSFTFVLYWMQTKEQKWRRPGNEARVVFLVQSSFVQKHCKWNSMAYFCPKGGWNFHSCVFLDKLWKYSWTWVNFWAVFHVKPQIHKGCVENGEDGNDRHLATEVTYLGLNQLLVWPRSSCGCLRLPFEPSSQSMYPGNQTSLNRSCCKLELVRAKTVLALRINRCNLSAVGCSLVKLSTSMLDSCCAYCSGEICVSHCCICYSNGVYPYRLYSVVFCGGFMVGLEGAGASLNFLCPTPWYVLGQYIHNWTYLEQEHVCATWRNNEEAEE